MKIMSWGIFIFFQCVLLAESDVVLIIGDNPTKYIPSVVEKGGRAVVVVPTDQIAKKVRKQWRGITDITVFATPIFSHTKRFALYALDPLAQKITFFPQNGARLFRVKQCHSLDDFCRKAGIPEQSKLIVDWSDDGYYIVRYADVHRFHSVMVRGLSEKYSNRLARYFNRVGKELL